MRVSFVSAFLVAVVGSAYAEQTTVPTAFPADRYAKMREKSPFALATPPVAPAAPAQAPFTQNLVLSGLSLEVNERGEDVIWALVTSRDRKEQFSLEGDKPSAEGISIASLEKSPKIKLMLRKGNELGSVEYDEAAVAPQAPPQPPNVRPGQAPQPGQPRSTNRIQIPRPNVAPQVNVAPGAPAPAPAPGNVGRRVRVIQSRPAQ